MKRPLGLRWKFALLLLASTLVLAAVSVWVVRSFLPERLEREMASLRSEQLMETERLVRLTADAVMSHAAVGARIKQFAEERDMQIRAFDLQGNLLYEIDRRRPMIHPWNVRTQEIVTVNGKAALLLHVSQPLRLDRMDTFRILLQGLALLFLVGLALFVAIAGRLFVRPILELRNRIAAVSTASLKLDAAGVPRDEIGQLYRSFNELGARLEQSQRQQLELLAAISHDIRTPLTSIRGYAERLASDSPLAYERRKEYLEVLLRKSADIEHLMRELTDFAQYEAERLERSEDISRERQDAEELFAEMAEEGRMEAELAGADWVASHRIGHGAAVLADRKALRRVLANLLSNAFKYAAVRESPETLRLVLSGWTDDSALWLLLEDNGPGAREANSDELFRRFRRGDPSRSRDTGGSGLGLAICRSIVEAHGGGIEAFDKPMPDGGFAVRWRLPLAAGDR